MVITTGDSKTPVISVKKLKTWIFFWNISQAILTKAKKIKRLAGYNNNLPFVRVRKNILCRDRWQLVPNKNTKYVITDKFSVTNILPVKYAIGRLHDV